MNFIKSVLSTIVNLAIGPFLQLRRIRQMSIGETVVNAVGVVTRVTVAASFFVTVPALAVKLSLLWIFGGFILAAALLGLSLLGFVSFMGYAVAMGGKEEIKDVAEAMSKAADNLADAPEAAAAQA